MAATTYTGTGAALAVTNTVNGKSFQPDFVWMKQRNAVQSNVLEDSVRGATKYLVSDTTGAEVTDVQTLTSFNTNGFSLGTSTGINANAATYIGWQWRASNASAVTNTAGTITSSVSANQTAGFSIVTWTGTGANATVGHGLGVAPKMFIVKNRTDAGSDWEVYNINLTSAAYRIRLNVTAAQSSVPTLWNSTAPTSTVFSIGTDNDVNGSGKSYVAYCFAAVPGYSAFGSYTGNGSTDGPFVYTGFRPRWVMIKSAVGSTGSWWIYDSSRDTYNVEQNFLMSNNSNAETVIAGPDFLSNGFKLRTSTGDLNTNGSTFIYAAFAENPFKNALAR